MAGSQIDHLIQLLARLPGLGPRSARRAALHLITRRDQLLRPLTKAMQDALDHVDVCSSCGNIDTSDPCGICCDPKRDAGLILVVEDVADLWALERAGALNARYHVLGGVLSALDGIGPQDLRIAQLVERAGHDGISEVVIAVNATVEGETTAHYITDALTGADVKISRLAHGVPVGGELDYLDEGTLTQAIRARTPF